jgi:hypothetical protein
MTLKTQPVQVATGSSDHESRLVFEDGLLVAVLVQLSTDHASDAGKWFLEAGFGRADDPHAPVFDNLEDALARIARQLARDVVQI